MMEIKMGGRKMSKFNVGDRVVVSGNSDIAGMKGVIVSDVDTTCPGVKFKKKMVKFHSCGGSCKSGYGYYVSEDDLKCEVDPNDI